MKPNHAMFAGSAERYQLQLRMTTSESSRQTLWDRSGAGRKFALREAATQLLRRSTTRSERRSRPFSCASIMTARAVEIGCETSALAESGT
jgi:hypothetical protein